MILRLPFSKHAVANKRFSASESPPITGDLLLVAPVFFAKLTGQIIFLAQDDAVMHEGQTKDQEQQNPIQSAPDGDTKEDNATTDVHRISRPSENAGGRQD